MHIILLLIIKAFHDAHFLLMNFRSASDFWSFDFINIYFIEMQVSH
jgi:hypothetical protein